MRWAQPSECVCVVAPEASHLLIGLLLSTNSKVLTARKCTFAEERSARQQMQPKSWCGRVYASSWTCRNIVLLRWTFAV